MTTIQDVLTTDRLVAILAENIRVREERGGGYTIEREFIDRTAEDWSNPNPRTSVAPDMATLLADLGALATDTRWEGFRARDEQAPPIGTVIEIDLDGDEA